MRDHHLFFLLVEHPVRTLLHIVLQCAPDNGETVKWEFWIKGKVPTEPIFYVVNYFG